MVWIWYIGKARQDLKQYKYKLPVRLEAPSLAKYVNEKLGEDKSTPDGIKNLWCGRTKLFEFDFNNIVYTNWQEYQNNDINQIDIKWIDLEI